jgi:hypothetical protein
MQSCLCVAVRCSACRHRANADLQALIDSGRGDAPLIRLRYRCSNCPGDSQFTDWVVTNDYQPQPWRPVTAPPPERKE